MAAAVQAHSDYTVDVSFVITPVNGYYMHMVYEVKCTIHMHGCLYIGYQWSGCGPSSSRTKADCTRGRNGDP